MNDAITLDELVARPFVKWTGSKRQLVDRIVSLLGEDWDTYVEPFVGGGSVYFHLASSMRLRVRGARLRDANARLVRTYRAVRDNVEDVIAGLRGLRYKEEQYYRIRAMDPDDCAVGDHVSVAVWLLYLNKTCFNGLYRVNKAGRFNVPFGRYTNPTICDAANLRACSRALANATVEALDFECTLGSIGEGVACYLDPPYVPISATADFKSYTVDGFTRVDHVRLRDAARQAGRRGARVVLSNSDAPLVRELYSAEEGFKLHEVEVRRSTSSKVATRGKCGELLIEYVG